jgi:hypothetical protein
VDVAKDVAKAKVKAKASMAIEANLQVQQTVMLLLPKLLYIS